MLATTLTLKISDQLNGMLLQVQSDPANPEVPVRTGETTLAILGVEDSEIYTSLTSVLEKTLAKIDNPELATELNDALISQSQRTREIIERLYKLLREPEYLKANQFPQEDLTNLIAEFNDLASRWKEIETAINAPVRKIVEKVEDEIDTSTATRLDKLEVSAGEKTIIDVNTGAPAQKLAVTKTNAANYKQYLIKTARDLALKDYHFEWMRRAEARAVVKAMKLTGPDAEIFWLVYRRESNKLAPGTIVEVTKEKIATKFNAGKDYVKAQIGGAIGRTASGVFDLTDLSVTTVGQKLRVVKRRKKGDPGILRAGATVLDNVIKNITGRVETAVTAVKSSRLVRAVGTVGGVGGKTLGVGGAAAGGASKGLLVGGGLAVTSGLGLSPAGLAVIGTVAGVSAVSEAVMASKGLAEVLTNRGFARAATTVGRLAALERIAKFTNRGLNGGFIGGVAGGLLIGGPAGVLAGALLGGGAGVASKVATEAVTNRILAGKAYGTATKIPFSAMSGQVDANLYAQTMVKIGLSDTFIGRGLADSLDALGLDKGADNIRNIKVSEAERMFYDPRRISAKNPLPLAMNALGLAAYFGNSFALLNPVGLIGMMRGLGISRLFPTRFANFVAQARLTEAVLQQGTKAEIALAVGGSRAATIMKGASVGSLVGTVIGIAVASAFGFNIGIGAAIGGMIGTVVGGIGAALVSWGSGGIGVAGAGAMVAGSTAIGTVAGAWVDTKILNKLPKMMNPLVLIQGIFDVMKLFNMRITSLKDYGEFAIVIIGVVNFMVFVFQFSGGPTTQKSAEEDESGSAVIFTTQTTAYTPDYRTLKINENVLGSYTFENIDRVEELTNGELAIIEGGNYWVLVNPGKYVYDPGRKVLAGKGKGVEASVYQRNPPRALASAQTSSAAAAPAFNSVSFCEIYYNLCPQ